jgi:hypothetical protein
MHGRWRTAKSAGSPLQRLTARSPTPACAHLVTTGFDAVGAPPPEASTRRRPRPQLAAARGHSRRSPRPPRTTGHHCTVLRPPYAPHRATRPPSARATRSGRGRPDPRPPAAGEDPNFGVNRPRSRRRGPRLPEQPRLRSTRGGGGEPHRCLHRGLTDFRRHPQAAARRGKEAGGGADLIRSLQLYVGRP